MAKYEERVNLRLTSDVHRPYERLAQLLTGIGHPMTTTQLVRYVVETQVEQTEHMVEYFEALLRGDLASAHRLYDKVLDWNQATIEVARAAEAAEMARAGSAAV